MTQIPTQRDAKAALRARIRAARRAAPRDADRGEAVSAAFLAEPRVAAVIERARTRPGTHRAAGYVSTSDEPPTQALRQVLAAAGLEVWLPVAAGDRMMRWVPDPGPAGDAAAWGLPRQPTLPATQGGPLPAVDLILVPALAATPDGRRLGQGGGYYDAWLASLPRHREGGPLRVALVGPGELVQDLPTEPHDQGVDAVVVA